MKAVLCRRYGGLEVLEVARPVAGPDEVLVAVRAASVNPLDGHAMRGSPAIFRLLFGLTRPRDPRFGIDFAGRVVAVGERVTGLKVGDDVFGSSRGAFAEFVRVRASRLALKPANVTFEQAACLPIAGVTALQGLRDVGRIGPEQTVLIHGASGGVGTFAVQIAKALGARVTAVCSTRNLELVHSLGADRVIDYTGEDFTQGAERYDLVFDSIGNHSVESIRRVLKPRGVYVVVGAPDGRWLGAFAHFFKVGLLSLFSKHRLKVLAVRVRSEDLAMLAAMMAAGQMAPVTDRRFPLAEVAEAIRYVGTGRARGKVVIQLEGQGM